MAQDNGLQLLPNQQRSGFALHMSGSGGLLWFAVLVLILVSSCYGGLVYFRTSAEKDILTIDDDLMKIQQSRDRDLEKTLINTHAQLSIVTKLLAGHIAWSDTLMQIQRTVDPDVVFTSLEADMLKRQYEFRAVASSYAIVAKQLAALYHLPIITDVRLPRVQLSTKGNVEFNVELKL